MTSPHSAQIKHAFLVKTKEKVKITKEVPIKKAFWYYYIRY